MKRTAQAHRRRRSRDGFTLIELLVFLLIVGGAIAGGIAAAKAVGAHGALVQAGAATVGGVLGGAAALLSVYSLLLPFEIASALRRGMEPADLVCRCCEPGHATAPHLLPQTPLQVQAIAESRRLAAWSDYARTRLAEPATIDTLLARLRDDSMSAERVALVACLNGLPAESFQVLPARPAIKYRHWFRLPPDIQTVIRSGLPPRLCVVWALACAERALAVFEAEFHEDTRPRQWFGAALTALRDGSRDVLEVCPRALLWHSREGGCRVLHRDLITRLRGCLSRGDHAAQALWYVGRAAQEFLEPDDLWRICTPGTIDTGYLTPTNRCDWSQPCFNAESVAYEAALAAEQQAAERQWQREELNRLVLGWKPWSGDREQWRLRVEEAWIPKVWENRRGLPFDVPSYVERIQRELIPWRKHVD